MHRISSGGSYVIENGVITKVGYSTAETTKNPELLVPQPESVVAPVVTPTPTKSVDAPVKAEVKNAS